MTVWNKRTNELSMSTTQGICEHAIRDLCWNYNKDAPLLYSQVY